jgi:NADH-quinone oxidoreductase subunit G
MPKLIIDNREIEVPAGTKVIEAAEKLGIMIPRFCYHPALGSVGACRVCAVNFLDGPVKGIQMSCMVDVRDGMKVSTTDEETVDFRKHVIEFLMLNHPHDCPVCDEGGHCLLQDMTVSGGHGLRRYKGDKRTHVDQYLGPLVQHEMNRCIQCYRCVRYYQEFTGYRDLGVMGIGSRVYYGRFQEGTLESPFAGNLIDVCPTGVYTDKPSRYKGRRWDFERCPSICIHCSLGCHTTVSVRCREVIRQEARFSPEINGHFICDRGRYGFYYASLDERPREGRIDKKPASVKDACQAAARGLEKITRKFGKKAIACAGSSRSSLETLSALKHLCKDKGWQGPVCFTDEEIAGRARTAVTRLEKDLAVSLRDIEKADFILAAGTDPINEAPMLAVAMRQAWRNGAKIVVVDPRPVSLPFEFQHLPIRSEDAEWWIGAIIKRIADKNSLKILGEKAAKFIETIPDQPENESFITSVIQLLKQSTRPVIVCGIDSVSNNTPGLAADLALMLRAFDPASTQSTRTEDALKQTGLFYVMPGANAFSAALVSEGNLEQLFSSIENESVKALIIAESDPFWNFPDRKRLEQAIGKLDLLVVMDCVNTQTAQAADIFIPAATLFEAGGTYINQEGRIQRAKKVFKGGIPILQTGKGGHPPRFFSHDIPGSDVLAAWLALGEISGADLKFDTSWIEEIHRGFDKIFTDDFPEDGLRLEVPETPDARFACGWRNMPPTVTDELRLIPAGQTFGTEELSVWPPCLKERREKPCLIMHAGDAAALGLADQDRVILRSEEESIDTRLKVVENMAPGVIVLPRHEDIPWQNLGNVKTIKKNQILKRTGDG